MLLLGQARPDSLGGVALLPPALPVLVEPALDHGAVRVELGLADPLDGHLGGEVVRAEVLVDGVPADALRSRYLCHALPLPPEPSYIIYLRHADHFLSGLLGRHRQNSNY